MNLAITKNRGEHITRPRRRANVSRVGPAAVSRVPPREATLPRGQRGSLWRQRGHVTWPHAGTRLTAARPRPAAAGAPRRTLLSSGTLVVPS
jgi:hypothetical protein